MKQNNFQLLAEHDLFVRAVRMYKKTYKRTSRAQTTAKYSFLTVCVRSLFNDCKIGPMELPEGKQKEREVRGNFVSEPWETQNSTQWFRYRN